MHLPKLFCVLALALPLRAAEITVTDAPGADDFILAAGKKVVAILIETNAAPAVARAAGDLANDLTAVMGMKPEIENSFSASEKTGIIIGTLGQSEIVDRLAAEGKLSTNGVTGEWESYVLQVVKNPLPGLEKALVIAGSDRRGTVFGIYELSERIGVSPWNWWADVPVKKQSSLGLRGDRFVQGPPAVKYRGIFLNDEDFGLRPWASKTFDPATTNIGPKTYAKVFELLLRLHANYLWPAMHHGSRAFNLFPENKLVADHYGIVMGSAHCEQMLRNNVDEWDVKQFGEYNYVNNRAGVLKYWEQRVRENAKFESTYTVGMRGIHDSGMPGGGTEPEQAARLHAIIADQRDMLARLVNPDVAQVPQIFCPYKEVLGLYRLASEIPDDITLVWPDDNFGYVREFSNAHERQRRGGAGVYYHISYWGAPYNYLWLNSTPPALIAEEMTKAFDYGANKVWLLNVGDLKPGEIGIEFFLRLAWNPHQLDNADADTVLAKMAARDFGPELAPPITEILDEYYRLNFPRKPEYLGLDEKNWLLNQPAFSTVLNGDETELRLAAWRRLVEAVAVVETKLTSEQRDAFFELVGYPVRASAAANEKGLALARYFAASAQGRINTGEFSAAAQRAQAEIHQLTKFYNEQLAGGKWRLMMSDHPGDLSVFRLPQMVTPEIPMSPGRLGVVLADDAQAHFAGATNAQSLHLPEFNRFTRRTFFADVFDGGTQPINWTATPSADWIKLSANSGGADARVRIIVDWKRVPVGDDVRGEIVFAAGGQKISVAVDAFNPAADKVLGADFVEDNRRVVMEAEHASALVAGADAKWKILRGLGYNGEAVAVFPATVAVRATPEKILAESPCLQFKTWLRHAGDWKVMLRTLPTFSVETGQPQRYAIAFDDALPQIVSLPASMDEKDPTWQENVMRNAALTSSRHAIKSPGRHTLKVWMVDPGIVIDTLAAENNSGVKLGYLWPEETKMAGGE